MHADLRRTLPAGLLALQLSLGLIILLQLNDYRWVGSEGCRMQEPRLGEGCGRGAGVGKISLKQ